MTLHTHIWKQHSNSHTYVRYKDIKHFVAVAHIFLRRKKIHAHILWLLSHAYVHTHAHHIWMNFKCWIKLFEKYSTAKKKSFIVLLFIFSREAFVAHCTHIALIYIIVDGFNIIIFVVRPIWSIAKSHKNNNSDSKNNENKYQIA